MNLRGAFERPGAVISYGSDPTTGAGVSAPLGSLLVRTDNGSIYYKSAAGATAWTLIGVGGSVSTYLTTTGGTLLYGPGVDGDLNFDGVSNVLGLAPVAGVYTLTRAIAPANMVVGAGVIVDAGAAPIFVRGTLSGAGTIRRNGAQPAPGAAAPAGLGAGTLPGSGAGGNGTNNNGGPAPNTQNNGLFWMTAGAAAGGAAGQPGANGGVSQGGGGGGSDGGETGGAGGAIAVTGSANDGFFPQCLMSGRSLFATPFTCASGGGGGAGGSGGGNPGGSGGSGGGWVTVACGRCTMTGSIEAKGGAGGLPHPAQTTGAGGGGGGGGVIVFVAGSGHFPNFDVSGGAGGAGQGAGQNGGNGGAGLIAKWLLG